MGKILMTLRMYPASSHAMILRMVSDLRFNFLVFTWVPWFQSLSLSGASGRNLILSGYEIELITDAPMTGYWEW